MKDDLVIIAKLLDRFPEFEQQVNIWEAQPDPSIQKAFKFPMATN